MIHTFEGTRQAIYGGLPIEPSGATDPDPVFQAGMKNNQTAALDNKKDFANMLLRYTAGQRRRNSGKFISKES
jgi:hypothetical protein